MSELVATTVAGNNLPHRAAYRIKEFAQIVGVSEKSVRRAIARGLIKVNRSFRIILIPATEVSRFVNA
jgi:hypothetical protein